MIEGMEYMMEAPTGSAKLYNYGDCYNHAGRINFAKDEYK
jgi:hypothetical protein